MSKDPVPLPVFEDFLNYFATDPFVLRGKCIDQRGVADNIDHAWHAEARLSEGDLSAPVRVIECWTAGLNRTSFQLGTDSAMVGTLENGSCAAPLDRSSRELGLPTLESVDPALLAAMNCAADHGLSGCD